MVAVGLGNYLHQVTVGVVEIDPATTVQMIDLAGLGAPRIGIIPDALSADAGERRVELGVAAVARFALRAREETRESRGMSHLFLNTQWPVFPARPRLHRLAPSPRET